jgi:tricarballylate dehydrogenase
MNRSGGPEIYDVVVVGGGNAGLCAAITARRLVPRVLLLERAPRHMRGGNTRHTRNIRCAHDQADAFTPGVYGEEELLADLARIGGGRVDPDLARLTVRESASLPDWMARQGVRWQPALRGTLHLNRTNRFFLGGGTALVNAYYHTAEKVGVEVRYEAGVEELNVDGAECRSVLVGSRGAREEVRARAFVMACGGYEANIEWLKRHWGEGADNYAVRGTPYNDGTVLAALLRHGARSVGDPKGFHAIAVDARGPRFDGGIVTRLDSIPFSIVVNRDGLRFYDEGEDIWPRRYASWGGLIAAQPGQVAYSIFDSKVLESFIPPLYKPYAAATIGALADELGLEARTMEGTVAAYNTAAAGNERFDPSTLDGLGTRGLSPPKSNWALPIDRPPFYGLPLRTGVTFTYMGVGVDAGGRVQREDGSGFSNLYAAGEIMSGNILSSGYLGGFGLTIGTAFGRIAGREAAAHAA